MVSEIDSLRDQLWRQVAHWRIATSGLADPEDFAPASAWQSVERYLGLTVRGQLSETLSRLRSRISALERDLRTAESVEALEMTRRRIVRFRQMFLQTEQVIDFFGEAINSRVSVRISELLSACDRLAFASMKGALDQLTKSAPPVLTYLGEGLGASLLKQGLRLWDGGSINPVAAIKVVRHNLLRPAGSLFHESGHQVAHITGWNGELRGALRDLLQRDDTLASRWSSWTTEVAADAFAFACTGFASTATLYDVLAGDNDEVFRIIPGDPHPEGWLRLNLSAEWSRLAYGRGPWDDLQNAWALSYPLTGAARGVRDFISRSLPVLPDIASLCLDRPMVAFGGRRLRDLINPGRVSPDSLEAMATRYGHALTTSEHVVTREGVRLAALHGLRMAQNPQDMPSIASDQERWMRLLGSSRLAAAA